MNEPGPASWSTWTSRSWAYFRGGGWRDHGLVDAPDRKLKRGNGFDYWCSLIINHFLVPYSEILPAKKGP